MDILILSEDPTFAGPVARALGRVGLPARTLSPGSPPSGDADSVLLDVRSPAALAAAGRWLRARPGRYAAAVGDRLGRDSVRRLYEDGLVRYLRASASPERIAACLAGDADRAKRLRLRAERDEGRRRQPAWRRAVARAIEAVAPGRADRTARIAAFAGLSVIAGLLLGASLQTAAETTTAVERLEKRLQELQQETSAVRDFRPAAPPASPPWAAPDRETRRPN